MTRYLISFDDGAMTFPEEDLPAVAEAAHAVAQEAMDAGVWVFGGGLHSHEEVSVVATDRLSFEPDRVCVQSPGGPLRAWMEPFMELSRRERRREGRVCSLDSRSWRTRPS